MVYLSPFYFPLVCLFISPGVIFLLLISLSASPRMEERWVTEAGWMSSGFHRLCSIQADKFCQLWRIRKQPQICTLIHFSHSSPFPAPSPLSARPPWGVPAVRGSAPSSLCLILGQGMRAGTGAVSSACLGTRHSHLTAGQLHCLIFQSGTQYSSGSSTGKEGGRGTTQHGKSQG